MKGTWDSGDGIPKPYVEKSVLARMKAHHQYERAVREERLLDALASIVTRVAAEFKRR
jgi:hypothetical protein